MLVRTPGHEKPTRATPQKPRLWLTGASSLAAGWLDLGLRHGQLLAPLFTTPSSSRMSSASSMSVTVIMRSESCSRSASSCVAASEPATAAAVGFRCAPPTPGNSSVEEMKRKRQHPGHQEGAAPWGFGAHPQHLGTPRWARRKGTRQHPAHHKGAAPWGFGAHPQHLGRPPGPSGRRTRHARDVLE